MKLRNILYIFCLSIFMVGSSCKKLVQVPPPITTITSDLVFTNDGTATAALVGIYSRMMGGGSAYPSGFASGGSQSISLLCELSADGLTNYNTTPSAVMSYFYANAIPIGGGQTSMWNEMYQYIYTCNVILENVPDNPALSAAVRTQIIGEAKFIRAFCYFYLTNLFGDVPLITSSDYVANGKAYRDLQTKVYGQIIQDLLDAQSTLPADYPTSSTQERVRPNRWAATALLARVYLYMGQWADAEAQSSSIINNGSLYSLPVIGSDALNGLNTVFVKNSKETIWALKPVLPNYNTWDATLYLFTAAGPVSGVYNFSLATGLEAAFESGDLRHTAWIGNLTTTGASPKPYFYANKYKLSTSTSSTSVTVSEYNIVFRLAEQYLIRAEARAMQSNMDGAALDLNRIRNGAGLGNTTATDPLSMVSAIVKERRVELFCEWGHRWFDLKRTKTIDQVMSIITPLKGGTWDTNYQLFPIPQSERLKAPNLTQNPGYAAF